MSGSVSEETKSRVPSVAKRALSLASAVARHFWQFTQELLANQKDKRRIKRLKVVQEKYKALDRFRPLLELSGIARIDAFYKANEGDLEKLEKYFCGKKYENLYSHGMALTARVEEDRKANYDTYVFEASSDLLISQINPNTFSHFACSIAEKYRVSASSNALLTGVLAHQRSFGYAALSAAEGISNSYRAGAHNEEARAAFVYGMRSIIFRQPASDLSEAQKHFTRISYRLLCLRLGDLDTLKRAYFSLVYNYEDCQINMSNVSSEFRDAVLCEFKDAFGDMITTPSHAAALVNEMLKKYAVPAGALSEDDIRPWMQKMTYNGDYWPA